MNTLAIASTEADAAADRAIRNHHAEMAGALARLTGAVLTAASRGDAVAGAAAQEALARWCTTELVPHAVAEERGLYLAAAANPEGRLLIDALIAEHGVITGLVAEVTGAPDLVTAAAVARALRTVFESHAEKENELVLPLLAGDPAVSLAGLLDEMHHELTGAAERAAGEQAAAEQGCGSGHTCGCGESDGPGLPELDARSIPHAIRHATIFGALETVGAGDGLVLLAPHDPLPLLRQIGDRWPGRFEIQYLERGPETWRLAFTRAA